MAAKKSQPMLDHFIMNNCKIANELRKYRDLAGCLNLVSLSGEQRGDPRKAPDYAEYYISRELDGLDMVAANAAYTLQSVSPPQAEFQAELIARIMAGNLGWRILEKRRHELEARLQLLAETRIVILAEHDHQVEQDLYEGAFLPVTWTSGSGRVSFRFTGEAMPLYQYALHHRHLITVPFQALLDDDAVRHNNSDRLLLLRHFLLQEIMVLLNSKNRVKTQKICLLKQDREGRELGLLWRLDLLGDTPERQPKDPAALARKVQATPEQRLAGWQRRGVRGPRHYQMLGPAEGWGVRLFSERGKIRTPAAADSI